MKLLTINEVKEMLGGASTQWINRQILDGRLDAIHIANKPQFYPNQIEAFINDNAQNYREVLLKRKGGEVQA
ncbi:hypothetical protein AGMMS49944_17470 [Spirochaetia bacterium]|nr:hypothetical protein AGMMS49944_17470 [Spirochaetia bacterium]